MLKSKQWREIHRSLWGGKKKKKTRHLLDHRGGLAHEYDLENE